MCQATPKLSQKPSSYTKTFLFNSWHSHFGMHGGLRRSLSRITLVPNSANFHQRTSHFYSPEKVFCKVHRLVNLDNDIQNRETFALFSGFPHESQLRKLKYCNAGPAENNGKLYTHLEEHFILGPSYKTIYILFQFYRLGKRKFVRT